MRPGAYLDREATQQAEADYWTEHGYRFGGWAFLPETGEVRQDGTMVCQLSPAHAATLNELIAAHPKYVAGGGSGSLKVTVHRLREILGAETIVTVHEWGYRFNPEAVIKERKRYGNDGRCDSQPSDSSGAIRSGTAASLCEVQGTHAYCNDGGGGQVE